METPLPRYLPGYRVKMGYLGLYRFDEQPTDRDGNPINPVAFILGIRYMFDVEENEEGGEQIQPQGWEYQIWRITSKGHREEGWYTEAELIKHGYPPSEDRLGGESELEMMRRLA